MLPGGLDTSVVREFTKKILVNGIERRGRWSTSSELQGDLPVEVASANGISQIRGSITWDQQEDMADGPSHPFRDGAGWVPQDGDKVQIYESDGLTSFPRFTGKILTTAGSLKSRAVSTLIDDSDRLTTAFNYPPVIRTMPPLTDGGAWRRVATSPVQVITAAAAQAGYRSVHPPIGTVLVDAPLQGSAWPLAGRCVSASNIANDGGFPNLRTTASFGWGMHDLRARYTPQYSATGDQPLQLMVSVGADHSGAASIFAHYGASNVRLRVSASRVAEAWVGSTNLGGRSLGSGVHATLHVSGTTYTLKTASGTSVLTGAARPTTALDSIEVVAAVGANIAGVSAARTWTLPTNWSPDLVLDVSYEHMPVNPVIRAIESSTVADTLDEISRALLLAIHFDELGRLVVRSADRIAKGPVVRDTTTAKDVVDIEWETNLLSRRKDVTVTGLSHVYANTQRRNVEAYRGSGDQMEEGESRQDFVNVPADEEWLLEWDDVPAFTADVGAPGFNTGRGSFVGGSISQDGEVWSWANDYLTVDYERVSYRTLRFTHTVSGLPAGWRLALQTAVNSSTALWPKYQGFNLPVIRCPKVTFAEAKTTTVPAATDGPSLEHPVGHWAGWESGNWSHPDYLRDFIAALVTAPYPVIQRMPIAPDPRLQKGDVIRVHSTKYLGVIITAVIIGIDEDHDDVYRQVLKLRVTGIETTIRSYDEWNATAATPLSYEQWDALAVQNYDGFTNTTGDPQ
ncbi:hypothetical protein [Zhihengliuella sp.]|uniref:hypothetical protein n=1 Tax=Zhihengliuella sp. TaxID=1954483 RepID=UPI0028116D05|nr:hypothetical protein [Zhihengliuella sp.]